jgi:hypothetical protein
VYNSSKTHPKSSALLVILVDSPEAARHGLHGKTPRSGSPKAILVSRGGQSVHENRFSLLRPLDCSCAFFALLIPFIVCRMALRPVLHFLAFIFHVLFGTLLAHARNTARLGKWVLVFFCQRNSSYLVMRRWWLSDY